MVRIDVVCHSETYLEPAGIILEYRPVQEDSYLHCLPREILEIIVGYLDGTSAARLASTCAMLFNFVNEVALWERYVRLNDFEIRGISRDIGLNFSAPIWRLSSPCSLKKFSSTGTYGYPWKQIFYCQQMLNSVRKWEFSLPFKCIITMDEITSVSIAGQTIVLGTLKGGLGLWNPDKSSSVNAVLHIPVEIDQILVQLSPGFKKEDLHYRVVIHGVDTSLIIYDMSGYSIVNGVSKMRDLRKISSHGDSVFEWDPDRGNSAMTIVGKEVVERCSDFRSLDTSNGPFVAVDIIEQLIISQKKGPLLIKYDHQTSRYKTEQLLSDTSNVCIFKAYIWPGQVSFNINTCRNTIISIGRSWKVIKWPIIFRCVSASLFANVLIVGTDVGRVLFYPMKERVDLLQLDPKAFVKELYIGTREPIIYVGVRVQNHIHQLPDVVAATGSKLFCFRATDFLE